MTVKRPAASADGRQTARAPIVKPEYGPTLAQLLASLPRAGRLAMLTAAVVLIAAAIAFAVRPRSGERTALIRRPVTFNLLYPSGLQRTSPGGALLALERRRGPLFLESYVVRPLVLPAYRGVAGGFLPLYAFGYIGELRRRYAGFDLVSEARARINNAIGYQVVFRAKRGARTLYGRHLLLVPELPDGLRRGVVIELASTPAAGTPNAEGTGGADPLRTALRSFRFGTRRADEGA
ncbi:MAG: hypothetical protein M3296_01250 [Actinomycetota bacterium]|nr:hypothetical protein [Actinomycetota bacterium]